MIPQFPDFKELEISDRESVESFTCHYPPYSDFNFTSLWSWNIRGKIALSMLHTNLVIRFTDYITNDAFLSFLGATSITPTLEALFAYLAKHRMAPVLRLVPEITASQIDQTQFSVREDRDSFDYIYDVQKMTEARGKLYETYRNMISRCRRRHPYLHVEEIDLGKPHLQEKFRELLSKWLQNKIASQKYLEHTNEAKAIRRFLDSVKDLNGRIMALGLFDGEKMVGATMSEGIDSDYALTHFAKTDTAYAGSYSLLLSEEIKLLNEKKYQFLNYEQDLGIPALRYAKNSYRPLRFLKKYTISKAGDRY